MKRYLILPVITIATLAIFSFGCEDRLVPDKEETNERSIPKPYIYQPEVPAEFPGGNRALVRYLSKNLRYPQAAATRELVGNTIIRFTIDSTGNVRDVQVACGMPRCPECDKEAMRVLRKMPRWSPGMEDNKPVNSTFQIPIWFIPQ